MLKNDSIDFVLNHPPYVDIIKYSDKQIQQDLSNIYDLDIFCDEMEKVAKEFYRVLKLGKYCAILIGDTRHKKMYQPLAFKIMQRFLKKHSQVKNQYIKVIQILEIDPYHPSLRIRQLQGRLKELHSISINMSYRISIEFIIRDLCINRDD